MTQKQLAKSLTQWGGSAKGREEIVDAVIYGILDKLKEGEEVSLTFGKFFVKDIPERSGSMNGKAWTKPAHKAISFKLNSAGKSVL